MKSSVGNICVFDLETTGLVATKHAIVEIAMCPMDFRLNDLKEFDSGIMKVYDNREVTDGALNANGITRDQLHNGVDPKETIEKLCKYLDGLKDGRTKPILAGHNIDKFDIPFLVDYFNYFNKDLTKYINEDFTIDTVWWARLKWEESPDYKLGTCCSRLDIELVNAHRAMADTRANKNLVREFIKSYRSEGTVGEVVKKKRKIFQF